MSSNKKPDLAAPLLPGTEARDQAENWGALFSLFLMSVAILTSLTSDLAGRRLHEGEPVATVVNTVWVEVRSSPEIRPETVITRLPGGTQLALLGESDGWYRVELPNGETGWLSNEYSVEDFARTQLEVITAVAKLRVSSDPNAEVVAQIAEGLRLEIIGEQDNWYSVLTPQGDVGWIRGDLVRLQKLDSGADREQENLSGSGTEKSEGASEADPAQVAWLSPPSGDHAEQLDRARTGPYSQLEEPQAAGANTAVAAAEERVTVEPDAVLSAASQTLWGWAEREGRNLILRYSNPEKREVLLVSGLVGFSIFVILSLMGTFILFQRDLEKTPDHIGEACPEEPLQQDSPTVDMADEFAIAQEALLELDHEIEPCMTSPQADRPHNLNLTSESGAISLLEASQLKAAVQQQQEQISRYLELITLQNRKLQTFRRETERIQELPVDSTFPTQGWEYSSDNERYDFGQPERRKRSRLTIRPA